MAMCNIYMCIPNLYTYNYTLLNSDDDYRDNCSKSVRFSSVILISVLIIKLIINYK